MPRVDISKSGGGGSGGEKENDWQDPYDYCGVAPLGTTTAMPFWTITRIEVFPDGSTDVKTATMVAWDNRYIVIYT